VGCKRCGLKSTPTGALFKSQVADCYKPTSYIYAKFAAALNMAELITAAKKRKRGPVSVGLK